MHERPNAFSSPFMGSCGVSSVVLRVVAAWERLGREGQGGSREGDCSADAPAVYHMELIQPQRIGTLLTWTLRADEGVGRWGHASRKEGGH